MGSLSEQGLRWLLTYGLHSSALLGLVWILVRWLPKESNRAQECLWRCAMLGPLMTASLQTAWQFEPLAGRIDLPGETQQVSTLPTSSPTTAIEESAPDKQPIELPALAFEAISPTPALVGNLENANMAVAANPHSNEAPEITTLASTNPDSQPVAATNWIGANWRPWVLGLWALGGLLGMALLFCAWRHILNRISNREDLTSGPLFENLQELSARAQMRRAPKLCVSPKLSSPATVGVWRPQICVPTRVLEGLSRSQQKAMLGHELAHVLRHDPLWFFLYRGIERILFFQPLNRLARSEMQELAEFQCDDWAANQMARPLDLAECLTEVAGWLVRERPQVALLPMAGSGSQLGHRVRRLLDEESRAESAKPRRWATPLAGGVLVASALVLPGIAHSAGGVGYPPGHAALVLKPAPALDFPMAASQATITETQQTNPPVPQATDKTPSLTREIEALLSQVQELEALSKVQKMEGDFEMALRVLRHQIESLQAKHNRLQQLLAILETPNTPNPIDSQIDNNQPTGLGENQ